MNGSFTERQKYLLKAADDLGYGYRMFAYSVMRQGWCSPKQEQALESMVVEGTYRKNNWRNKKYGKRVVGRRGALDGDGYGCKHSGDSDAEAMQSGDYF